MIEVMLMAGLVAVMSAAFIGTLLLAMGVTYAVSMTFAATLDSITDFFRRK